MSLRLHYEHSFPHLIAFMLRLADTMLSNRLIEPLKHINLGTTLDDPFNLYKVTPAWPSEAQCGATGGYCTDSRV